MILVACDSRLPGLEHAQSWQLALPDTAAQAAFPVPLVLFLHDLGQQGTQLLQLCSLAELTEKTGAAFLMPNGLRSCFADMRYGPHWRTFLTDGLLPFAARSFPVTPTVLALGVGTGGWAAAHLRASCPSLVRVAIALDADPDLPLTWSDAMALAAVFGERNSGDPAAYTLPEDVRQETLWRSSHDPAWTALLADLLHDGRQP